ncbi:histidine phosphatase family protein [Chloroflexota bacterium]
MPRLFLVRHGLIESNISRHFAGYTDVEMSPVGYGQVDRLRNRLANEKFDAIYSSNLKRALTTAELISSGRRVNIIACPELREINYGKIEGLTFQEIEHLYPDVAKSITNFTTDIEFPNDETFREFIERVRKFLEKLEQHTPEQTVLIVSHSGPVRLLICSLLGIEQKYWRQFRCDNASLNIVETNPRGAIINLLNDTSHLSGSC